MKKKKVILIIGIILILLLVLFNLNKFRHVKDIGCFYEDSGSCLGMYEGYDFSRGYCGEITYGCGNPPFESLQECFSSCTAIPKMYEDIGLNYQKTKSDVYYGGVKIDVADIDTFKVFDGGGVARDRENVFLYGVPVEVKGTGELVSIHGVYYKNDEFVYRLFSGFELLQGANPVTFQYLGGSISKDQAHVFCGSDIIESVDAESFEILGYGNYRDRHALYFGYYCLEQKLSGVSFETLELLEDSEFWVDEISYIYRGFRITSDEYEILSDDNYSTRNSKNWLDIYNKYNNI